MIAIAAAAAVLGVGLATPGKAAPQDPTAGCLEYRDPKGVAVFCPLRNTKVEADIAGFGARVTVTQTFANPSKTPIEAVYTFPLPNDAAVDRMNLRVGERTIEGKIKRRDEARRIYDDARNSGRVAGLLDQERPNIFTQSVANIMPGETIQVEISYVQVLKFENGTFEFNYPMVVGHRYTGQGTTDPDKILPPITPKGTRTGAGIELTVNVDAGMPIESFDSVLHDINVSRRGDRAATVKLAKRHEIPNRDFIFRYRVAGKKMKSAFLSYADPRNGGFFTLILMPPQKPAIEDVAPKEVLFVMDQSGSQQGFPIEKSKELTRKLIGRLNPQDTFNVISFNTQVTYLWPAPRRYSEGNAAEAWAFVSKLQANGGTHLIDAVHGALSPAPDPDRRRIVVFNTDGYIGNDFDVLDAIAKSRANSRMFTFGIGNSVNRFLIDGMSREGRGAAEYVTLAENADAAAERFIQRTRYPVLMDVEASFEGIEVADVLPRHIPDVFGDHPVIIKGRYTAPGRGRIVLRGLLGGEQPWSQSYDVNFPDLPGGVFSLENALQANAGDPEVDAPDIDQPAAPLRRGSAIATLWAREMVDEVSRGDYRALQQGRNDTKVAEGITRLGLAFGLMTQYTSFVAVENKIVNVGGKQRTVRVPVEMADGVSYEGIFGAEKLEHSKMARGAYRSGGAGGGGFGGVSGVGPPTSVPSIQVKSADASYNVRVVPQAKDLKSLSDADVIAAGKSLTPAQESEWLKGASPDQRARYLLLTRVDRALRESKLERLEIQVLLRKITPEMRKLLQQAGMSVDILDAGTKTAFGSCSKAALAKLASVEGVAAIKPL